MLFPAGAAHRTSPEAVKQEQYDAVIVGSGVAGALIAKELSAQGHRVLILEAGLGDDLTWSSYQEYLSRFYGATVKDNQSPYAVNPNAPMPRGGEVHKLQPGHPDGSAYLVQTGPFGTDTVYTRVLAGTTMHWEAKTPRMLPEDFQMRSHFGTGPDWPISYDEIEQHYREAEREMGVSGDVAGQREINIPFPDGYEYPMYEMPLSYLDKMVAKGIDGTSVSVGTEKFDLKIRTYPQARNGIPNPKYDLGGEPYVPVGAVSTSQIDIGGRCQGNNNCVPICPVQAKYHAGKTLAKAMQTGKVDILARAVATRVVYDKTTGRVQEIQYKRYKDANSPVFERGVALGRIFVIAANAIETPRLMLASDVPNSSGLIGRNLMDHAYLLCWGLMPERCGTFRGTNCTGGIVDLRSGAFRSRQAAFAVDIHNDGWGWAVGSPYSDLLTLVDVQNRFGRALRQQLAERVTRQLLLAFMVEMLPSASNRVTVDPRYVDALENMRPVISFEIPEYTLRGVQYARQFAQLMFQRLGAADYTAYDPDDYGYVTYEGEGYAIRGGNHLAGTHVMGKSRTDSVVDRDQLCWDHENLYLVGGGSMPSIGTSNITLTIAALTFRTARQITARLAKETQAATLQITGETHASAHD